MGQGDDPSQFLVNLILFTLNNVFFEVNSKLSPPKSFKIQGVAPLNFRASYASDVLTWYLLVPKAASSGKILFQMFYLLISW